MSNNAHAIALLQQAIALLAGAPAAPPTPQAAPPAQAPPPAAPGGQRPVDENFKMPFGQHKDWTLRQLADHHPDYLGWVADKFGFNKDGSPEDPRYAAKNAQVRALAAQLVQQAALPAPPPPPAAPVPPPAAPPAAPPPYEAELAQAGFAEQPAAPAYPPQPPLPGDDAIPF